MNINALGSEQAAIVATIDPDALAATTHTSDYVDASEFANFMAIGKIGTMAASSTFDMKLVQATDSGGTGKKDITGKAITQLTQASPDDSDKQVIINLKPEELDVNNDFTHFAVESVVGVDVVDGDVTVLGLDPRHGPASDNDLASVTEIVN